MQIYKKCIDNWWLDFIFWNFINISNKFFYRSFIILQGIIVYNNDPLEIIYRPKKFQNQIDIQTSNIYTWN